MIVESTVSTNVCTAQAYRELGFLADLIAETQTILRVIHSAKVHDCRIVLDLMMYDKIYPSLGIRLSVHTTESGMEQLKIALKGRQTVFDFGTITIFYVPCSPNMFTLD